MAPKPCATADQIRQFAVGELEPQMAERLSAHLAECPACQTTLLGMKTEDTFVTRLRAPKANDPLLAEPQCQAAVERGKAIVPAAAPAQVPAAVPEGPAAKEQVFDPYYSWLGIPPHKQPPNHYTLLGIGLLESDPVVIQTAAEQRIVHLRTFQLGPRAALSQKLLNEVAAAKTCLLDPARKAAHDAQLREKAPAPAPATRKVSQLGDYQLLAKLGEGGMGTVYKARHRTMKRVVALKVLSRKLASSDVALKRFRTEAQAAARLMHQNIVTAFDAGEHSGVQFLVMEYVEGQTLAELLKTRGPLPVAAVINFMLQAAWGLQYAHQQGVVHRDIKPGNLLVDREGTVKILDMGLARLTNLADRAGAERLTGEGQALGTCDYMAPEQAEDTHEVDGRADIYALGCTLYRLLTGESPYKGSTPVQVLLAHRDAPLPSLQALRPDVPADLDAVFRKMVAKRPADRFASMTEVIAALETISPLPRAVPGTMGEGPGARGTQEVCLPKPSIFRRRPRTVAAVATGLAAAIIVFGVVLVVRNRQGRELTRINAPDGSQVAVQRDGSVTVTVPGEAAPSQPGRGTAVAAPPRTTPGPAADVASAAGTAAGTGTRPAGAPPPAVAPFDPPQARQHQEAWARHLGLPVAMTNSQGIEFVLIPPSQFEMGSSAEQIAAEVEQASGKNGQTYLERVPCEGPRHRVELSRAFYLGKYPVTQGEYQQLTGVNPSAFCVRSDDAALSPSLSEAAQKSRAELRKKLAGQDTSRHPADSVSWEQADEFCQRLSGLPAERAAKRTYRLPTEAEWECACRAGSTGRWCFENAPLPHAEETVADYAWLADNSGGTTQPVGQKKPNAWGLFDMHGNVWQYCSDWFAADYYRESPRRDPNGPEDGTLRVLRGGHWSGKPNTCRAAYRFSGLPSNSSPVTGFRLVCVIPLPAVSRPAAETPATLLPARGSPPKLAQAVRGTPPPAAVAPFDPQQAQKHQAAWAQHLGLPVEASNTLGMKLALIPPGKFLMGSPEAEAHRDSEEGPQHPVQITRPYYLGLYEVTQEEFQGVMGQNPSFFAPGGEGADRIPDLDTRRFPVESVTWDDAVEFCRRLSTNESRRYRLPTEAEWEHACRAGTQTPFCWGDSLSSHQANFHGAHPYGNAPKGPDLNRPATVGSYRPNPFGLYDMHGNVWEWCSGWYDRRYGDRTLATDPTGPAEGTLRVHRGGSWHVDAHRVRSARRYASTSDYQRYSVGFRVLCEVEPAPSAARAAGAAPAPKAASIPAGSN